MQQKVSWQRLSLKHNYGCYHDANAVAIGAYYHPNDTTILSIGGSMGGGENMVNAGITWKMGRSSHEPAPVVVRKAAAAPVVQPSAPVRLAPVIAPAPVTAPVPAKTVVPSTPVSTAPAVTTTAMTAAPTGDTAALTQILARQTAILEKLAQNQSQAARPTAVAHGDDIFPDVPENHWAYAYVAKLEKAGALKGFKRPAVLKSPMMTRDDFASVLYTAMANGATTNPALNGDDSLNRLAQEFKAELKDVKP
ncbi:YadA-like family protein [Megasphaera elsdenii]|uniref:YadA-like family protein n=1 Tax=Megasphaera elsdenii TaxID=907 RepID=UPI00266F854B|nr:YadA-like family protein [Megasphaera elsdenii]